MLQRGATSPRMNSRDRAPTGLTGAWPVNLLESRHAAGSPVLPAVLHTTIAPGLGFGTKRPHGAVVPVPLQNSSHGV